MFTIRMLKDDLKINDAQAQKILNLMNGDTYPKQYASLRAWMKSLDTQPDEVYQIMFAFNIVLQGQGVEEIKIKHYEHKIYKDAIAFYVNLGRNNATTIAYDTFSDEYSLITFNDLYDECKDYETVLYFSNR